ncbi:MAG: general stress protein [Microbacteriaceae bacterium]
MSNPNMLNSGPGRNRFALPQGEEIVKFDDYEAAQQAITKLAQADFPVKAAMIVGEGLKSIERVTGKLNYARVALSGASTGIWLGLFFALVTVVIDPVNISGNLVIAALLVGTGVGAMIAVVFYSLNKRRREYTSVMQMVASSYSVQVSPEYAGKARTILAVSAPKPPLPKTVVTDSEEAPEVPQRRESDQNRPEDS